jgi:hypothetical protein
MLIVWTSIVRGIDQSGYSRLSKAKAVKCFRGPCRRMNILDYCIRQLSKVRERESRWIVRWCIDHWFCCADSFILTEWKGARRDVGGACMLLFIMLEKWLPQHVCCLLWMEHSGSDRRKRLCLANNILCCILFVSLVVETGGGGRLCACFARDALISSLRFGGICSW